MWRVHRVVVVVDLKLREPHYCEDGVARDAAEDRVLAVEVVAAVEGDEELRAIGFALARDVCARNKTPARGLC
jgi:hypothetical protein